MGRNLVQTRRLERRKLMVAPGESARVRKIAPFRPSPVEARVVSLRSTPRASTTPPSKDRRRDIQEADERFRWATGGTEAS